MQGAEVLARIEGADFLKEMVDSAETGAMLLAMSNSVAIDDAVKTSLNKMGYRFAVTEVGGNTSYNEFREKVTKAIVGAGLNCGVIKKVRREVHALLHAAEEAKTGALVSVSSAVDVSFKIGIVRDENWIAVAFFGKSAFYYVTNHRRAGMGVMHISPVV